MKEGDGCLITGGAGFIGSNLAEALLQRGMRVRVFDDFSTGRRVNLEDLEGDLDIVEGDLRDAVAVRDAARGCAFVFHEGAIPSVARSVADPVSTNDVNISGTLNVLMAARDEVVERVVFASSSSAYGNARTLPVTEDQPSNPISPYGVSKLAGERYLTSFHASYGLPAIALRYFNVFGPRQDPNSEYAAVVPRFVTACLESRPVTIFGDGEQLRDFTFVGDVVAANLCAAEAGENALGRWYNIAGGNPNTVNTLLGTIQSLVPTEPVAAVHEPPRVGDIRESHADVSAARELLDFRASFSFEDGLRRTVEWFAAAERAAAGPNPA